MTDEIKTDEIKTEVVEKRRGRPPRGGYPTSVVENSEVIKNSENESSVNFLPEITRQSIINQLKELGTNTDGLNDAQLIELLNQTTSNLSKKQVSLSEIDKLQNSLNVYADKTLLTDKEFIKKLYNLNVPKKFLELFRDHDREMTRKQIWERIRVQPGRGDKIKQIDDFPAFIRRKN